MPKVKSPTMSLEALEVLLKEVVTEGATGYQALLEKVLRAKPGTERHSSLLCDLWTAANVTSVKAKVAEEAIDEYLDTLPDDDDG